MLQIIMITVQYVLIVGLCKISVFVDIFESLLNFAMMSSKCITNLAASTVTLTCCARTVYIQLRSIIAYIILVHFEFIGDTLRVGCM